MQIRNSLEQPNHQCCLPQRQLLSFSKFSKPLMCLTTVNCVYRATFNSISRSFVDFALFQVVKDPLVLHVFTALQWLLLLSKLRVIILIIGNISPRYYLTYSYSTESNIKVINIPVEMKNTYLVASLVLVV